MRRRVAAVAAMLVCCCTTSTTTASPIATTPAAPQTVAAAPSALAVPFVRRGALLDLAHDASVEERLEALEKSAQYVWHKYGDRTRRDRRRDGGGTGTAPLGDVTSDIQYVGTVSIGTPAYDFSVILDTGSSDMLIATAPCDLGCHFATPIYHPSLSSTAGVSATSFDVVFGTGAAQGVLVQDKVSFAGFTLPQQVFAAADNLTNLIDRDISGLLGLGWQSLANSGATPFVQALWEKKMLASPVFGFAFARWNGVMRAQNSIMSGGLLSVGEVNSTFYDEPLNWIPLTDKSYWQIALDNVSVNGDDLPLKSDFATIDTGTSLIGAPAEACEIIYASIPGSRRMPDSDKFYSYPCDATVSLAFTFNGVSYSVSDRDFNNGATDTSGQHCVGGVFILSDAHGKGRWIFGDAFLKNVYSAFRFEPPAVGFAPITTADSVLQSLGPVPTSNATLLGSSNFSAATATSGARRRRDEGFASRGEWASLWLLCIVIVALS